MNNRSLKGHIRQLVAAGLLTGLGTTAYAGDFSLASNQISLSPGGAVSVADNGLVAPITIGTINTSDDLDQLPTWSFTLQNNGDDGVYTVRVGVVIESQTKNRRLEASIGQVEVTVSGGDVTGITTPSGQIAVRAFDIDTFYAFTRSAALGVLSISGNDTINFNGDDLVNLTNEDAERLLEGLTHDDQYTYSILFQLVSGPDMAVGTMNADYVPFPRLGTNCTDSAALASSFFTLSGTGNPSLAGSFSAAYGVRGTLTIGAGTATTPAAITNCVAPSDDPDPTDLPGDVADLDEEADTIVVDDDADEVTPETVTAVNNLVTKAVSTSGNVATAVADGTATVSLGVSTLTTVSKILNTSSNTRQAGGELNIEQTKTILQNTAKVLASIAEREDELTAEERTEIQNAVKSVTNSVRKLILDSSDDDELNDLMSATSDLINNAAKSGAELDDEVGDRLEQLAARSSGNILAREGIVGTPAEIRDQLRNNPEVLDRIFGLTVAILSPRPLDSSVLAQRLTDNGLSADDVDEYLALISTSQNPNFMSVGNRNAMSSLLAALGATSGSQPLLSQQFLSEAGVSVHGAQHNPEITIDEGTGLIDIRIPGERYVGMVVASRVVSDNIPEGITYRSDGRAVVVANGMAVELAPVSANLIGFLAAVQNEGFAPSMRNNGAVSIDLGNGERFAGVFDYQNLDGFSDNCGAISIQEPSGALNSPAYAFVIRCANGIEQRVVPYPDNQAFFRAVRNEGFKVNTNRNTGVIEIVGEMSFKPSYFVRPLTSADQTYWNANATADGIAFRAGDFNGNGIPDYEVISQSGVQVFYGVP